MLSLLVEQKKLRKVDLTASLDKIRPRSIVGIHRQKEQFKTLLDFKTGKFNILIATDIAEDGIDIRSCQLVINFDLPATLKSMIQVMIGLLVCDPSPNCRRDEVELELFVQRWLC